MHQLIFIFGLLILSGCVRDNRLNENATLINSLILEKASEERYNQKWKKEAIEVIIRDRTNDLNLDYPDDTEQLKKYLIKNCQCEVSKNGYNNTKLDTTTLKRTAQQLNWIDTFIIHYPEWNDYFESFHELRHFFSVLDADQYIMVSPIYFNQEITAATIIERTYCGRLCGHAILYYLKKENGNWRIMEREIL